MNRLTDNDRNYGPFTLARWSKRIGFGFSSGDEEDGPSPINTILMTGFGWALRIRLPKLIQPHREKVMALSWDAETVKRIGRNWYYKTTEREYGFALSDMGNGYDFLQVKYGRQSGDSSTEQSWCKHLSWKQWSCVRSSVYAPDGTHFASENKSERDFCGFMKLRDTCLTESFGFEDYDGEMIVATCMIEEREWRRGEGWFKWLRFFWPAKVRRSLDIKFSAEVGPEKGSWKGGTLGHGIEMLPGETPRMTFERYCSKEHDARQDRKFRIRFIGPANHPISPANSSTAPG